MNKRVAVLVSSASILLASSYLCCSASGQEETLYSEAQFQIPTDPTRAVLHVTTSAMDMTVRSMTLYGNGRLELTDSRAGEYERQLDFNDVQAVVKNAVAHGLAEWDNLAIRSKQLTKRSGKLTPVRADAMRATVLIGVDDYRRGSYEVERAERTISISDPEFSARHFPDIPQFQGVVDLVEWMIIHLEAAKAEAKEGDQ